MAEITICSDFGAKKKYKVIHCFHCFPIYLPWGMGPGTMILDFWMLSYLGQEKKKEKERWDNFTEQSSI